MFVGRSAELGTVWVELFEMEEREAEGSLDRKQAVRPLLRTQEHTISKSAGVKETMRARVAQLRTYLVCIILKRDIPGVSRDGANQFQFQMGDLAGGLEGS
jgi:hypothetical protein